MWLPITTEVNSKHPTSEIEEQFIEWEVILLVAITKGCCLTQQKVARTHYYKGYKDGEETNPSFSILSLSSGNYLFIEFITSHIGVCQEQQEYLRAGKRERLL